MMAAVHPTPARTQAVLRISHQVCTFASPAHSKCSQYLLNKRKVLVNMSTDTVRIALSLLTSQGLEVPHGVGSYWLQLHTSQEPRLVFCYFDIMLLTPCTIDIMLLTHSALWEPHSVNQHPSPKAFLFRRGGGAHSTTRTSCTLCHLGTGRPSGTEIELVWGAAKLQFS